MFVKTPPNYLQCGICLEVLNNPKQCMSGHIFCLFCLTRSLERNKHCPVCKTFLKIESASSSLLARNLVFDLVAKCNCGDLTCEWQGPLSDIESHKLAGGCILSIVDCSMCALQMCINCSGKVSRKDLILRQQVFEKLSHFRVMLDKFGCELSSDPLPREHVTDSLKRVFVGEHSDGSSISGLGVMRYTPNKIYSGYFKGNMSRMNICSMC
jgi:hypothetical protein